MRRRTPVWASLALLAATAPPPALAQARAHSYLARLEPAGDADRELARPGWGLGSAVALPLPGRWWRLAASAGADGGGLRSQPAEGLDPITAGTVASRVTQDYFRIFAGVEVGRHGDARVDPHAAAHLALTRQEVVVHTIDPATAQLVSFSTDTRTRLGWDVSAGVAVFLTRRIGLDLGARYLARHGLARSFRDAAGRTVRPDYLQFHVGLAWRFPFGPDAP